MASIFSDQSFDIPIPDQASENKSTISFGTLIKAQSLGDRQALMDAKRDVIRIQFTGNQTQTLQKLTNLI